jgi:hypothetical protein
MEGVRIITAPAGNRTPVVHPIENHCTDRYSNLWYEYGADEAMNYFNSMNNQ